MGEQAKALAKAKKHHFLLVLIMARVVELRIFGICLFPSGFATCDMDCLSPFGAAGVSDYNPPTVRR